MGGTCGTHAREERYLQGFGKKERDSLPDGGVDGRIILKYIA
jgi:hypothetical protein